LPEGAEPSATRRLVLAGLELLDLEASDDELAVIEVVDSIYRPLTDSLLEAELDGVEPEPGADLSRGPRDLEER
jgi:hypothetical protein